MKLSVNYKTKLSALIKQGNYDYVNSEITDENFPTDKKGKTELEVELFDLDTRKSTDAVLALMDKAGLRPATMVELLSFGAQYPDEQRRYPIVALGSVWTDRDGYRYVGYLWGHPGYRHLYLYWLDLDWPAYYRFLAVRKSALGTSEPQTSAALEPLEVLINGVRYVPVGDTTNEVR